MSIVLNACKCTPCAETKHIMYKAYDWNTRGSTETIPAVKNKQKCCKCGRVSWTGLVCKARPARGAYTKPAKKEKRYYD